MGEDEAQVIRRTARLTASAAGFTLIELLAVVVILGILASVVVFATGGQSGAAVGRSLP